jgi:hypothetical protein
MLACLEVTLRNVSGVSVLRLPTIGIGTLTVLVTLPPLPSSKVSAVGTPVTFSTVW